MGKERIEGMREAGKGEMEEKGKIGIYPT